MMKKNYLWMAVFASMMVACSGESDVTTDIPEKGKPGTEVATQQTPVTFGAYVNRATTRAGAEGVLTTNGTDAGQVSLEREGFGVFAYYTDDDQYSPIYQPNFMYNTKVSGSNWTYAPVRYWPNEFGADASSVGVDRLSFFAYAPHVEVTPSTGIVTGDNTYGIVGLSRNAATGDPLVKYYASLDPSKQVDFCWGVDKTTGKPIIDLTKQGVNEKVEFAFNHALAALNVQIDAAIDQLNPGGTLGDNTKIYVRSVTFEGFVTKGAFNLNTDKATWYDLAGANYIDGGSVTIFDGRTNGKEGQSESANESPVGLNPVVVQSQPYSGTPTAGVTPTAVNLFNNATATAPLYVIPSGQPLNVTIVYDVETQNPNLTTKLSDGVTPGTSVENKITKTISFGTSTKLEAGKKYNLTLHLGMTSVKFDASVAEWDENTDNGEAGLPDNIGTAPVTDPTGYFRGYDVSRGVLKRNTDGTYELTPGTDPFEMYTIYNYDADTKTSQYYFKWSFLKSDNELGADSSGNINANSTKLPSGWTFPSFDVWKTILKGTPKLTITVGGVEITKNAFAVVQYNDGTGNKKGVLLLRDGVTIDSGYLQNIGSQTMNTLTGDQYNYLLGKGCVILSYTGYLTNSNRWHSPNEMGYGAVNHWTSDNNCIDLSEYAVGAEGTVSTTTAGNVPVRLVKLMD